MDITGLVENASLVVQSAEENPQLWASSREIFEDSWPEYNKHANDSAQYFGELASRFARFQFLIIDRKLDAVIARGRTIPFAWDGTLEDLPQGIDDAGLRGVAALKDATTLSALAAEVVSDHQGRGLSALVVNVMARCARQANFRTLVAPVRPNWKDRYPLIPIERYVNWRREDGFLFDPWLRVHERLGARTLRATEKSMRIEAPIADWEHWTNMVFPDNGEYVFPHGLSPLRVFDGTGFYWEPNVWMCHDLDAPAQ